MLSDLYFRRQKDVRYSADEIAALCKSDLIAFLEYIATYSKLNIGDIGMLLKMRRCIMWCQSMYVCMHEASNNLSKVMPGLDSNKYACLKGFSRDKNVSEALELLFNLFATNVAVASSRRRRTDKQAKGPSKSHPHFTAYGFRVACDGM